MNDSTLTTVLVAIELLQFAMLGGLLGIILAMRDELAKIRERLATVEGEHARDRNDKMMGAKN